MHSPATSQKPTTDDADDAEQAENIPAAIEKDQKVEASSNEHSDPKLPTPRDQPPHTGHKRATGPRIRIRHNKTSEM